MAQLPPKNRRRSPRQNHLEEDCSDFSRRPVQRAPATLLAAVSCAACLFLGLAAQGQNPARQPWTTSRVHGSPVPPEPYRIAPAFANLRFQLPTSVEEFPSGRLLVTQRDGKIFSFPNQAEVRSADLVADLAAGLSGELAAKGVSLFAAELHPKFADNRFLFVCYVHPDRGGHTRLSRLTLTADDAPRMVPGSEKVILTWPSGGHNAGCLEFGTDGFLYIATGDGSGPNPPDGLTTGQTRSEEHTSELQSLRHLVCRLLLEKKK